MKGTIFDDLFKIDCRVRRHRRTEQRSLPPSLLVMSSPSEKYKLRKYTEVIAGMKAL